MINPDTFLQHGLIYLAAAVIAVPLSSRLGLGSVLGYLLAGAVIGPFALNGVGDPTDVMHAAEFGVVLMLFIIGLELQPHLLMELRQPILVGGSMQMGLTTLAITVVLWLCDFTWQQALAIGLIFSLSSTAIVLQSLAEKGLLKTQGGTHIFGVLLFQDIAIIPLLSLLPLLGVLSSDIAPTGFSAWQKAGLVFVVAIAMVLLGRFVVRPLFRLIAQSRLQELSIAAALLIVLGSAFAMQAIGLSPALGTFFAGLILADSEYRHELAASIEPFKGLLLGLFFITVGASIDFELLLAKPLWILCGLGGLIIIKLGVLWLLAYWQKLSPGENSLFAFSLAQGGEFAFVLLALTQQYAIIDAELLNALILIVALSMALTPILMLINEHWIQPRLLFDNAAEQPPLTTFETKASVLILGFGRFGQMVGRVLSANGFNATVIDHDAAQIDFVSKFGFKVYYGDAARLDLLQAAGAAEAEIIVVAIEEMEASLFIVDLINKHFSQAQILARARNRSHAYELMSRGITQIFRDTFGTAVDMSMELLVLLGFRRYQALRAGHIFKLHDAQALKDMYPLWRDEKTYISRSKQIRQQLEYALTQDRERTMEQHAEAWHHPENSNAKQ